MEERWEKLGPNYHLNNEYDQTWRLATTLSLLDTESRQPLAEIDCTFTANPIVCTVQ